MWTWKVWRSEAITTTYESLAIPFLLEFMQGTTCLPVMMLLPGCFNPITQGYQERHSRHPASSGKYNPSIVWRSPSAAA